jgi:hypothetical protein
MPKIEFYKSLFRSYGFVPRGQTYTDDQTHGHFLKLSFPTHQSETPNPRWAPSHDAQQKWRFVVGSAVTDALGERCVLECEAQTVQSCWICRQYYLPKRPEPLAQHSHIPRKTNRLTASNIAEGEPPNQNLNKRSNQPNARTVVHVSTPNTHNSASSCGGRSHLESTTCSSETRWHQLTNQLTSWNRGVLKKLTVAKLIKNVFAFCRT